MGKKLCCLIVLQQIYAPLLFAGDARKELSFVIEGMRDERAKIKQGLGRIKGKTTFTVRQDPAKNKSIDFEVFFAFEDQKKIRFDRTQLDWVTDPETIRPDPKNPAELIADTKPGMVTYKYCNNGKKMVVWRTDSKQLEIHASTGYTPPGNMSFFFFDVTALGLHHWLGLMRHDGLQKLLDGYESIKPLVGVEKQASKPWCVLWSFSDSSIPSEWRLYVDVENGFTPVRMEGMDFYPKQSKGRIDQESTTKWGKKGGTWVPVHCTIVNDPGGITAQKEFDPTGGTRTVIEMTIEWKTVNEPVRHELFEYQDFRPPKGIYIWDSSLGPTVILQYPNEPSERGFWPPSTFLVVSFLLLLVLGGALLLYRHKRRQRNKSA